MIPASISDYLEQNHIRYSVIHHPVAYTAQEEAAVTHVPGGAWAKSVVCVANNQPILAVVPASCCVDLERLQRTIDADSIRLANESEFVGLYKDCEPGAMPPLGPLFGQRVVVDRRLTRDPEIVFSGGSHHDAIRMPYEEFERLSHPTVAEFATGPAPATPRPISTAIDPVCGNEVDERTASEWTELEGIRFYFCGQACRMEFSDNPHEYSRSRRR